MKKGSCNLILSIAAFACLIFALNITLVTADASERTLCVGTSDQLVIDLPFNITNLRGYTDNPDVAIAAIHMSGFGFATEMFYTYTIDFRTFNVGTAELSFEGLIQETLSPIHLETINVTVINHNYSSQVIAPTYTDEGYTIHTCRKCSHTYKDSYTSKLPHNHTYDPSSTKTVDVEATCVTDGRRSYKCNICGAIIDDTVEIIPASENHTWIAGDIIQPTCKDEGTQSYTCQICGAQKEEIIPTVDHSWKDNGVINEPTYNKEGTRQYICTNCGFTKEEPIDKLECDGHISGEWVTFQEGDCKHDYIGGWYCIKCGYKYEQHFDKGDHVWGDWVEVKAPTAISKGFYTRVCSVCGKSESKRTPKLSTTIKISASPSTIICAGKKTTIIVSGVPKSAVTWISSNTKYAKVSNGVVTTKKAGAGKEVIITAKSTLDGATKTINVRIVKDGVKKITLSGKTSLAAGKQQTIKATVTAGPTANTRLKWSSSNDDYATVNNNGVVTAWAAGKGKKVKITASATDGTDKKAVINIKIT